MSHKSYENQNGISINLVAIKVWSKKGSGHDPERTCSLVKHGGGSAIAQPCMAASLLIFIMETAE